jgi:transcriptional regulator with XRE-family HTH domain
MDPAPMVDVKALHAALDAARSQKGLSWRRLAKDLGVSASTVSRMANGYRPDVSGFAAMTSWLRMPAEAFYRRDDASSESEEPELVAALAPLLRARKDLDDRDVAYLEDLIAAAARRFQAERGQRG